MVSVKLLLFLGPFSSLTPGCPKVPTPHCRDIYTPMFIAALSTTAKKWSQPRYLSTDGGIKKTWYIHTIEFYSTVKINEIMVFR